jgi:hypothetical protein
VDRSQSMVPVAPDTFTVTLPPPIHTGEAPVTVPATGAGLTVMVTAGAEVTVAHGELVDRTNMLRVTALNDELVKVNVNVVGLPLTVNECQVTWLSSEYSYNAPAIYGLHAAENDTVLPVQMVVAVVAAKVGTAVKFAFTTTLTGLEYEVHPPLLSLALYEYVPADSL